MTAYLTTFANILDELFKSLSDCGLMTSYTVQLQSSLAGLEIMLKFKAVIQELVKDLQNLLSAIPSIESAEASTQTLEDTAEVVVTCHPISLTTHTTLSPDTPESRHGRPPYVSDAAIPVIINQSCDEQNKDQINEISTEVATNKSNPSSVSSIELCELKPLIIEAGENFTELVNIQQTVNRKDDNMKVENIVHIVVETAASSEDHGETFHPASDVNIVKLERLQCVECDVEFKSREELKNHLQSRHSPQHHLQFCDMCDKMFNCVQSLQEHCRRDHGGAGCFVCTVCNKRFMTKLSYTRHLHTHNGRKEAVCDLCGKAFSRADYLQTHYSIHLGKRNFACSQCPRKFVRSIHLKAHEKIHSGVKEHVCKVCGKGFVRSDKLKEHTLRHLNIKRFQCPVCQRDYAEKRDLKIHLKLHSK